MKQLTINPSNKPYYSEDFIKGFECGTQRQLEADLTDRPRGKWVMSKPEEEGFGAVFRCSRCSYEVDCVPTNYCPNCGADMRGE